VSFLNDILINIVTRGTNFFQKITVLYLYNRS